MISEAFLTASETRALETLFSEHMPDMPEFGLIEQVHALAVPWIKEAGILFSIATVICVFSWSAGLIPIYAHWTFGILAYLCMSFERPPEEHLIATLYRKAPLLAPFLEYLIRSNFVQDVEFYPDTGQFRLHLSERHKFLAITAGRYQLLSHGPIDGTITSEDNETTIHFDQGLMLKNQIVRGGQRFFCLENRPESRAVFSDLDLIQSGDSVFAVLTPAVQLPFGPVQLEHPRDPIDPIVLEIQKSFDAWISDMEVIIENDDLWNIQYTDSLR